MDNPLYTKGSPSCSSKTSTLCTATWKEDFSLSLASSSASNNDNNETEDYVSIQGKGENTDDDHEYDHIEKKPDPIYDKIVSPPLSALIVDPSQTEGYYNFTADDHEEQQQHRAEALRHYDYPRPQHEHTPIKNAQQVELHVIAEKSESRQVHIKLEL